MALKILLADDNITAQKMGSKILTDAGYAVVAVSNGAAAMKKIVAEKPGLLILDVYMPGYSGLEVCEKVKSAAETVHVPVLLTVTNMEPFNAEDGNRVKADGVLIKPFEATDLLAVVHKLEEKLHAPAAEPSPASTQKIAAIKEFEDQSYAEWKAEAAPEEEAQAPEMSREVASSPALDIDQLDAAPVGNAPVFAVEAPSATFAIDSSHSPSFELNAPAPAFDLGNAEMQPAGAPVIAPPPELEFTSAPQAAAVEVAPAAELEVTAQEAPGEATIAPDAALVTDPTEITQFATKFGQDHPEEVPVGVAIEEPPPEVAEANAEVPEPAVDPVPPEPPSPHWADSDVRQALGFSGGAAAAVARARELEPAPEVGMDTQPLEVTDAQAVDVMAQAETAAEVKIEEVPALPPEPHAEYSEVTEKLVAQFAAELEAAQAEAPPEPEPPGQPEMEPPAAAATAVAGQPDEQHIAEAVTRVLERYKDELVAAIVRELKS